MERPITLMTHQKRDKEMVVGRIKKNTPILNPGVFTMFCPHGYSYGGELMRNAESPRIPFEAFVQRFRHIPFYLVYDNACKLHLYALKQEPKRIQDGHIHQDHKYDRGKRTQEVHHPSPIAVEAPLGTRHTNKVLEFR